MRLRNITGSREVIADSDFVVQESTLVRVLITDLFNIGFIGSYTHFSLAHL